MPSLTATIPSSQYHHLPKQTSLHTYHSDVMTAMCTQMADQRRKTTPQSSKDAPLPLAKKPAVRTVSYTKREPPLPNQRASQPADSFFSTEPALKQHVEEEMARRLKADRVLQDLSSDKCKSQARAREIARRNKWARTVAAACPTAAGGGAVKNYTTRYEGSRRRNPQEDLHLHNTSSNRQLGHTGATNTALEAATMPRLYQWNLVRRDRWSSVAEVVFAVMFCHLITSGSL
ncbi:hypothetical protein R6Q59_010035 [Mikania micrantha]